MPLSFILSNVSLFLGILTGILMGMLIGLSMIAQSVQPVCELGILACTMWGRMRALSGVVTKNLAGHRSRNRKTSCVRVTELLCERYSICILLSEELRCARAGT